MKAAADYVRRLVQRGFRVAICEQVEDPRKAKGLIRREVGVGEELLAGGQPATVVALPFGPEDLDG